MNYEKLSLKIARILVLAQKLTGKSPLLCYLAWQFTQIIAWIESYLFAYMSQFLWQCFSQYYPGRDAKYSLSGREAGSGKFFYRAPEYLQFPHPRPSFSTHYLVIPHKYARSIGDLTLLEFKAFFCSIKRDIVSNKFSAAALIVNFGARQDFQCLHGHIIAPALDWSQSGFGEEISLDHAYECIVAVKDNFSGSILMELRQLLYEESTNLLLEPVVHILLDGYDS